MTPLTLLISDKYFDKLQEPGVHACGPLQVGPASGKLATKPLQDWTARDVADTVLQDR